MGNHFMKLIRFLNALFILVLCGVLCNGYVIQFYFHEQPCPFCMLQRLSMMGVACGPALNLRFGIRPLHYGMSLLASLFGAAVGLRQIAYHVCPSFATYEWSVLGFYIFTWGFIVFVCSMIAISLFLLLYKKDELPVKMNLFEKFVILFILILALANAITTFQECGLTACAA